MRKVLCLFLMMLWCNASYAEQTQKPKKEPQPTSPIKQQPHPTPIHPCAPLEHCIPPNY